MAEQETERLVDYVSSLRLDDMPGDVIEAARNTIIDGVACCAFGMRFPWSRAIVDFAIRMGGAGGPCSVLGPGAPKLHPSFAALVNGALAHSFELDGGTRKGVGAHPFGTVFTSALPIAQANGASGRDLLTAFIAGSEALLRIGKATGRSNENRGFHAPGTTGPFGAAIACSLLMRATRSQTLDAVGIAGSLASGLRQFSQSSTGGMVKRLHFGRAAEAGVVAAGLAHEGFDGPHDILEGKAGFLKVFCDEADPSELVRGLDRETFLMREISMKDFATHGSTQAPLRLLLALLSAHAVTAGEIARVRVTGSREGVEHHRSKQVGDLMQAQYSIAFCVALACVHDIRDPRTMCDAALSDARVLSMLDRVDVEIGEVAEKRACHVEIVLRDGRRLEASDSGDAASWRPADAREVAGKYDMLMRDIDPERARMVFARLQSLEHEPDLDWLSF